MKQVFCFILINISFLSTLSAQWQKVDVITSPFVYSVLFDDDNIYAGGDSLYISRDRGLTWQASAPTGQPIELTAISKFGDIIYLGTYGSGVYISSNNGESWQSFNNGLSAFTYYAKKFVSSGDTIYYATDGGGVFYLPGNTNLWHSYNQNLPSSIAWTINDLVVTNNNLLASAGGSGYYYLRPKGSAEWIEKRMQTPQGIFMTPNAFFSTGDIVFSGHRFGIYKSLDEGNTFDSVGISAMDMAVVSFVMDGNRIYAGYTRSSGNDYFVWYSDDFGDSWNFFDHQFQLLLHLYVYDNKIWAGTNDGLWYKELETTSIEPIEQPNDFNLKQNYPNPFNPSTKISWQSALSGHQSLKVYDVLGNVITTLVDEERPAGKYDTSFNASGLASGIYFYKLQIGNYVETKKMILLR
jgi:photosystem II stability/assembly factor-like uncharacterized protein